MRLEAFKPWHLAAMDPQHLRAEVLDTATLEYGETVEGPAFTAWDGSRVMACGGIAVGTPIGSMLWSYIDDRAGRHFVAIDRAARRLIASHPGPLVAATERGFPQGCRWLDMLGFIRAGRLQDVLPEQPDLWLYTRGVS